MDPGSFRPKVRPGLRSPMVYAGFSRRGSSNKLWQGSLQGTDHGTRWFRGPFRSDHDETYTLKGLFRQVKRLLVPNDRVGG